MDIFQPPLPPMDFGFGPPGGPRLLDLSTIHVMMTITFLVQGVLIFFLARIVVRYRGVRMFLASTLVLAIGSLLINLQAWMPPGLLGPASSLLMFWGTALQYAALARFVGVPPSRVLLLGVVGGGTGILLFLGWQVGTVPFVPAQEALTAPLLFAVGSLFRRADIQGFRLGAVLTALPFLGYGVLSVIRVIRALVDPEQMLPGPNLTNDLDALAYFLLSFLWISGFLFMVNQRMQTDLINLASQDPLTGCLNRRAMDARLADAHGRLVRYGRPYTLILFDLDHFKAINDTHGHGTGDKVLKAFSAALTEGLRAEDSLARWGGEEFLVVLPETKGAEGHALAERLRLEVASQQHDLGLKITVSAGVTEANAAEAVHQVCHRADLALYQAKETRNRVILAPWS